MIAQTKDKKKQVILESPADQRPVFSPQFLSYMADLGFEALKEYLRQMVVKGRPFQRYTEMDKAIMLVEELQVLSMYLKQRPFERVSWLDNQIVVEALGKMSYLIPETDDLFKLPPQ